MVDLDSDDGLKVLLWNKPLWFNTKDNEWACEKLIDITTAVRAQFFISLKVHS